MCIYSFYIVSAFEQVFNPDTWRFVNVPNNNKYKLIMTLYFYTTLTYINIIKGVTMRGS